MWSGMAASIEVAAGEGGAATVKTMRCPVNGPRPVSEFHCAGEVTPMPDPDTCSDAAWADYVFNRNGAPAVKREWWLHVPSGVWNRMVAPGGRRPSSMLQRRICRQS